LSPIWQIISWTAGARIYGVLLGTVSLAITARLLGPDGRGILAAINTWSGLYVTFLYLSLGQVAIHRFANSREEDIGTYLGTYLVWTVILTIVAWGVLFGTYYGSNGKLYKVGFPLLALGFSIFPLKLLEHYLSSLLQCLGRLQPYNLATAISKTSGLILVLILVWGLKGGVAGVLISSLLAQTFLISIIGRVVWKAAQRIRFSLKLFGALLWGGVRLHLNAIASYVFLSIDILMLNYFWSPTEVGLYQLAVRLMGILLIIPQAVSFVLYTKVTELGPDGAWPIQRRIIIQVILGMAFICGIGYLLAPWGINLVAGPKFSGSIKLFRILLLAVLGQAVSVLLASQWIGRGLFILVSLLSVIAAMFNLGLNLVFIPHYGMVAAAWTTVATAGLTTAVNLILVKRCCRYERS